MKEIFKRLLILFLISFYFLKIDQVKSLIPYYYLPTEKNLKKQSLYIGKNAYQLLYFGQIDNSLNLAKLAVKINANDQKLWLILSETQIANKLYDEALISLTKAEKINEYSSEIYFAKSNIYLEFKELQKAKTALEKGLKLDSNNHRAIFQLGNIFLMEKNYTKAIKIYDKSLKIKPDFWQAINNKGLAYFEKNDINLSSRMFEKAISIQENAEPLLGLASCLRVKDIKLAIELAKKALAKDPNYVNYDFRKEQLWGGEIQSSVELLLKSDQLEIDVNLAKAKINASY